MSEGKTEFSTNYPKWRVNHLVTAFKIGQLSYAPDGGCVISPEDVRLASVSVSREWCERHRPRVGGYMLLESDFEKEWDYRRAEPFEGEYARMPD